MNRRKILLLYDMDYVQAQTVNEHVDSFSRYSSFDIQSVNVHPAWKHEAQSHAPSAEYAAQIKETLYTGEFAAVVLHYTLFGMDVYYFNQHILDWLQGFKGLKVAFFQDEYHQCPKRFHFIDDFMIDAVYTLIEPRFFRQTYFEHTRAPFVRYTIPGFVSEELQTAASSLAHEDIQRDIDVGYRGRRLGLAFGRGGEEKSRIGDEFKRLAGSKRLKLDIETKESHRIYGDGWLRFLMRCKSVLGVEAGVSMLDIEDAVRLGVCEMRTRRPTVSEEELYASVVGAWDGNIPYRMISPRHFEAAALGCSQILFEGRYSGIMEPGKHYIELKKDFSNIEEVLAKFQDNGLRASITENARKDLIDSGRWSYASFINDFDMDMRILGL